MSAILHPTRRDLLLNDVPRPTAAKAKPVLNSVQHEDALREIGQLLRFAIMRAGLTQQQAMDALGIEHKSQFSEMLDGKQKLWLHQLMRAEARPIWKELLVIVVERAGECEVERVIRIKEAK